MKFFMFFYFPFFFNFNFRAFWTFFLNVFIQSLEKVDLWNLIAMHKQKCPDIPVNHPPTTCLICGAQHRIESKLIEHLKKYQHCCGELPPEPTRTKIKQDDNHSQVQDTSTSQSPPSFQDPLSTLLAGKSSLHNFLPPATTLPSMVLPSLLNLMNQAAAAASATTSDERRDGRQEQQNNSNSSSAGK